MAVIVVKQLTIQPFSSFQNNCWQIHLLSNSLWQFFQLIVIQLNSGNVYILVHTIWRQLRLLKIKTINKKINVFLQKATNYYHKPAYPFGFLGKHNPKPRNPGLLMLSEATIVEDHLKFPLLRLQSIKYN